MLELLHVIQASEFQKVSLMQRPTVNIVQFSQHLETVLDFFSKAS